VQAAAQGGTDRKMSLPVQATGVRDVDLIQRVGSLDDVKRLIALFELNITVFRGQIVEILRNLVTHEVLSLPAIEQPRAFELINDFILNITAEYSKEDHGLHPMEVFAALLSVYRDVPTRMNYCLVEEFLQQMPEQDIEVASTMFQSAIETAPNSSFERTEN